jgi:hypothetical protein
MECASLAQETGLSEGVVMVDVKTTYPVAELLDLLNKG